MHVDPIVILSYARTPIGNLLGILKTFSAAELGAHAIKATVSRAEINPNNIDEVLMGCVLSAGVGQAPARQATLLADLPNHVSCTTINKVCGSGMKSVMLAHDMLLAGSGHIMVAGGMESMTNAPYLLLKARQGYRLGNHQIYDHMMLDGLEDAYDKGTAMGVFAEQCVSQYKYSRKQQDDFAYSSFERAQYATREGLFTAEITPLTYSDKLGEHVVNKDEHPFSVQAEKIPKLSPVFAKNGTITAGNSSSIADGAAAVTLMKLSTAEKQGLKPLAKILAHRTHSHSPKDFTTAPITAIRELMQKLNWTLNDIDLFEINEAFAIVTMVTMDELKIPREKVNIYGGACALGHPIGASGTRILVTLISALKQNNLKRGIAALCIGGGEATAIAIEIV